MPTISLVRTVHKEIGTANSAWLYEMLVLLTPDVIFLELSPGDFGDFYEEKKRKSTESVAVNRLRESHSVKLEPVDLDARTRDFCESEESMMNRIWDESATFRDLLKVDTYRVERHGFYYLNSDYNDGHWRDAQIEMQASIERWDDRALVDCLNEWKKSNDEREEAMLKNIETYCARNSFETGVFLIGSAHRPSILRKIRQLELAGEAHALWEIPQCFTAENRGNGVEH